MKRTAVKKPKEKIREDRLAVVERRIKDIEREVIAPVSIANDNKWAHNIKKEHAKLVQEKNHLIRLDGRMR